LDKRAPVNGFVHQLRWMMNELWFSHGAVILPRLQDIMKKQVILTRDGSHTIAIAGKDVMYHSIHGAIQESMHVYINTGLHHVADSLPSTEPIRVFEMGFGTGLNALLTMIDAERAKRVVEYVAIEAEPLPATEVVALNYPASLGRSELQDAFTQMHGLAAGESAALSPFFSITKQHQRLQDHEPFRQVHLVYYDAFAPSYQPELWTKGIFEKIYSILLPGGILTTYCSKGDVRRNMQAAGFIVTKMPGPRGKREMLRAQRPL
jgi:tRNA U34 5-methylaminomethyl-2-thiouridine-forming methyltransferase MnmC